MGGAGHEVRDLPQGPDVGGVVPLLHLLLDEAFQLLPERLKQAPESLVLPVCLMWETEGPSPKCPPLALGSARPGPHVGYLGPRGYRAIPLGPQEPPQTAVWGAVRRRWE